MSPFRSNLARIGKVVVQMVDDGGLFLIEFDAALTAKISDRLTNVGIGCDQNIAAAVDEASDRLNIDCSAKLCKTPKPFL